MINNAIKVNKMADETRKTQIQRGISMIKTYVVDTNILIQAPYAVESFEDNHVVIPMVVLEELDHLKKTDGEVGANARKCIRYFEKLRQKGNLLSGVELENGGNCRVEKNFVNIDLPEEFFKEFKKRGVPLSEIYAVDENGKTYQPLLTENQFVILKADQSTKKTHLGRVEKDMIKKLEYRKSSPYGISPRNAGQYFLQEALMQPASRAPLVIVKGMAGTSKTFYSLAVGLEKLLNHPTGEYRKILVCRPNAQFDDNIGFLPGDEQEKISPLMRPIIDNLEQLIDSSEEERYKDEDALQGKIEEIFARGLIQAEALNFIRGRSIAKTYLIIDEAQNTTPDQIKGIITRAGKDTKIILLGDPNQIDRPFLDERTNGLSYASEHMKGSSLCWQITMTTEECERSVLAMEAIKRL